MTYDVLEKVSKLFAEEKELLEKDKELNKRLEANVGNTTAFMSILIESQKNGEKKEKVTTEIVKLLNVDKGGEG